ncbi:hypothetical protein KCU73_g18090, partial [Aureobasidium melanogenum]
AAGIPTWSPTVVLICRSTAYVWQSGRDAQFSADCGRTCWILGLFLSYNYLDEYDDNERMAEMYQKHSRDTEAEGDWSERLRLLGERIAAKEEAEWHEMQERTREKSKEDAIVAARDMFDHAGVSIGDKSLDDVAASDQSQDRLDEAEDDK